METRELLSTFLSLTNSTSVDSSTPTWTSAIAYFSVISDATDVALVNGTEAFLNATSTPTPHYITVLKEFQKWLITVILVLIMLSMGSAITLNDFKETFRHPVGFLVGFISQFVTMPLICFIVALVVKLANPHALGLLIIGCCPGGTVSNLFTFWTKGDVCLSVCMTTISCIAAIGMMPLNLFIYSRRWTTAQTRIPFLNIFTTLVTIIIPALVGMVIRRYSLKWSKKVATVGSVSGFLCIPLAIVLMGIINPDMYTSGWAVWFSAVCLPIFGYCFGHGVAWTLRQPHYKCRTIGFETGVQNVALAITIMLLTFKDSDLLYDMLTIPALYGFVSITEFMLYVLIFRGWLYHTGRSQPKPLENEGDAEEGVACGNDVELKYHPIKDRPDTDTGITVKINGECQPLTVNGEKNGDYQQIKPGVDNESDTEI